MTVYALLRTNNLGVFAGLVSLHTSEEYATRMRPGKWTRNDEGIMELRNAYGVLAFAVKEYTLIGDYEDAVMHTALLALGSDPMAVDCIKDALEGRKW